MWSSKQQQSAVEFRHIRLSGQHEAPWELVRLYVARALARPVAVEDIAVGAADYARLRELTRRWALRLGLPRDPDAHPHGRLLRGRESGVAYLEARR